MAYRQTFIVYVAAVYCAATEDSAENCHNYQVSGLKSTMLAACGTCYVVLPISRLSMVYYSVAQNRWCSHGDLTRHGRLFFNSFCPLRFIPRTLISVYTVVIL
ncbi:hypothetical protein F4782DRAFT_506448 [Xylaria castorea]|nr:hypothetical protein F4782DRAFT_506448 [Xylaria castorea]